MGIVQKILSGDCTFSSEVWSCVSSKAKDFVLSLLKRDPAKRPTASQALASDWIRKQNLYSLGEKERQLDS